jgi:putative oxidoreductase
MKALQPHTAGLAIAVARILLAHIFLVSGLLKVTGFAGTAGFMASKGLPMPQLLLVITIAIEVLGALMIILGWRTRLATLILLLWMVPVTLVFHRFWGIDAAQVMPQATHFMKNLSIMGGLLALFAHGPGPLSVDAKSGVH